jgi:DNA-binding Lrp family transcriptional regulator
MLCVTLFHPGGIMKNFKLERKIKSRPSLGEKKGRRHSNLEPRSASDIISEEQKKNGNIVTGTSIARLDSIDINIIKELIDDPNVKGAAIAAKLRIASSTIQRRRAMIESSSILRKAYEMDLTKLGWREADLLITVEKGRCRDVAQQLLSKFKNNVRSSTLRIGDPEVNVVADIIYKSSPELLEIIENVKNLDLVSFVEWSEITEIVGKNNIDVISLLSPLKQQK